MQGTISQVWADDIGPVVYCCVFHCAFPSNHHGCGIAMLQSCYVSIWEGYDAQGLSAQHGHYGHYHWKLFTVRSRLLSSSLILRFCVLDSWWNSTGTTLPKMFSLTLAPISTYQHLHRRLQGAQSSQRWFMVMQSMNHWAADRSDLFTFATRGVNYGRNTQSRKLIPWTCHPPYMYTYTRFESLSSVVWL